jgi:DNA-binding NarL/FixJ family response regulator
MTGRLFLSEIVEAFIAMIQEHILETAVSGDKGQLMILSDKAIHMQPVELRLRNEGFRVVCETSIDSFADMFARCEPDVLLLISVAKPSQVTETLEKVKKLKSSKAKVPIFLLVKDYYTAQLTAVLDKGVEDIISLDNNLDILVAKLRRIIAELNKKAAQNETMSDSTNATGRISNISLIDILQALGPGQKTARIFVTSHDKKQKLEMYLDRGKIVYAKLGELTGAEAVYQAMTWPDGIWNIEPVSSQKLPEPNNTLSNESILMEGCRLMDEKNRTGQVII